MEIPNVPENLKMVASVDGLKELELAMVALGQALSKISVNLHWEEAEK